MNDPLDHYGLVLKEANRYRFFAERYSSVTYQDVIQEAWVAVIKKIEGHDAERGTMSTYLTLWIRDAIRAYIRSAGVMTPRRSYKKNFSLGRYIMKRQGIESIEFEIASPSPESILEGMEEADKVIEDYKYYRPKQRWCKDIKELELME